MPKFIKRPILIEARQFLNDGTSFEVLAWINNRLSKQSKEAIAVWDDDSLIIPTPTGQIAATTGDWIVKEAGEEFSSYEPDIFEAKYVKVIQD